MPIDPSIPLSIRPPAPGPSVLETYAQVLQLQGQRAQAQERTAAAADAQAKRARDAQIEQALAAGISLDPVTKQPTFDYEKALGRQLPPAVLFEVKKVFDENAERMARTQTANLTAAEKRAEYLAGTARSLTAQQFDPDLGRLEIGAAKQIGALPAALADQLLDAIDRDGSVALQQFAAGALARVGTAAEAGFTLGPGQVRYGPGGEQIAAGPPRESPTEQFTLSPGSVRFGPGGEQIAAVPGTPSAPRDERIVSVIGPDGKPIYVRESQALGMTPGSAAGGAEGGLKLTAGQQEDVATMLTVQDLGKEALNLGERIKWRGVGPIAGRTGAAGAKWLGVGGEEPERLRNLLGNIQGTIAKLRGGASFTPSEQIMLDRYTPTTTDSVLQIKAKLSSLSDFITAKRENTLRVAGGEYTPRGTPAPSAAGVPGPKVGERRTVNGQLAEWDGKGWKAVTNAAR